ERGDEAARQLVRPKRAVHVQRRLRLGDRYFLIRRAHHVRRRFFRSADLPERKKRQRGVGVRAEGHPQLAEVEVALQRSGGGRGGIVDHRRLLLRGRSAEQSVCGEARVSLRRGQLVERARFADLGFVDLHQEVVFERLIDQL